LLESTGGAPDTDRQNAPDRIPGRSHAKAVSLAPGAANELSVALAQVANAIVARSSNADEKKLQALSQIAIGILKMRV
jgi:hypothetical protein